ncbi:polysaccharide biosynthesis/export family protein [Mesorhizobium sp. WSM2239]|uniref:Polysaccharide biosynthesis/export family protein n=2 Tax=unclassified Mesorhizobium TaxID=325217 RepID=A0AAU8DHG3_9HYPH
MIPKLSAIAARPTQFRFSVLKRLALASAVSIVVAAHPQPLPAGEYLLGPQDKVRLKIYEWRPSRDVIFEWTALNDEFVVGADGTLFLPFAGQVEAQGTATSELAGAISDRLMQQMGLGRRPDVAVEIVQFRPFYIVGHVTQPGEFPYRPGLTVLQAIGIAGGLRTREENISRLEREVIAARGDVGLLELTHISLLARKARLEAELADSKQISFPAALTQRSTEGSVALLMQQERMIFDARTDGLRTQLRSLSELREFLEKELASLETQLTFHDKQVALIQQELSGVSSLVQKGLAAAPRELALERTLAQIQSDRLTAQTSLLRARQEISRTDIAIVDLRNRRANEVAETLRETQTQLNEITRRADTAVQLLHESEITAPALLAMRTRSERVQPVYKIVRTTGTGPTEFIADETTPIEPGDSVKIEIPLPQSAISAAHPAAPDLTRPVTSPAAALDAAGTN